MLHERRATGLAPGEHQGRRASSCRAAAPPVPARAASREAGDCSGGRSRLLSKPLRLDLNPRGVGVGPNGEHLEAACRACLERGGVEAVEAIFKNRGFRSRRVWSRCRHLASCRECFGRLNVAGIGIAAPRFSVIASTPKKRTRLTRGGGISAATRRRKSTGVNSRLVAPDATGASSGRRGGRREVARAARARAARLAPRPPSARPSPPAVRMVYTPA